MNVPPTRDTRRGRCVWLGGVDPVRSRQLWTRSCVQSIADLLVVGRWDGRVTAFDRDTLDPRWTVAHPGHAVTMTPLTDRLIVGSRGERGTIAAYDIDTGTQCWQYETATDIGVPTKDGLFALPHVTALESEPAASLTDDRGRVYAAAQRYERDGEHRCWQSVVLAFDADGTVDWRYKTDASSSALSLGERLPGSNRHRHAGGTTHSSTQLAVGYNRCLGDHNVGLVVLDADSGTVNWNWDPGTTSGRRVGDVAVHGDHVAVASHGDRCGYLLGPGGEERWRVPLATETECEGETLYAYPNHVAVGNDYVAFVTGNTYATESRDTALRHPNEHQLAVFDRDGTTRWSAEIRGYAHELVTTAASVVVPCAQNVRVRDPMTHGVRQFDLETGAGTVLETEGIATAVALESGTNTNPAAESDVHTIGAVEEPVEYHDGEHSYGEYALRTWVLE
ncbi:Pyrrolo-quinoline quinone repeat-containing protein [Natrialba hulunbeirensis JCM 10989]|uniref:Pyrrolo-quinoline quinone repeat-containing protein n=1 Tax=Natrialba hulunbeirensis JCM 10989 TaxID=1227493 RepID=M0A1H1_9EURY|nr:PQQ-binding-like beta-propeller repeat protein [Natrialba hulunbeirensis]ELY92171.1 Pyrrolo-quinoline quinone repeat-containing protein [Natrialba hulunbeirensis JCM 10989]